MRLTDRILSIPEECAVPGNAYYEEYRTGLQRAGIGTVAVLGGLAFNAVTGSDIGIDIAAGGAVPMWLGGAKMALNTGRLQQ